MFLTTDRLQWSKIMKTMKDITSIRVRVSTRMRLQDVQSELKKKFNKEGKTIDMTLEKTINHLIDDYNAFKKTDKNDYEFFDGV